MAFHLLHSLACMASRPFIIPTCAELSTSSTSHAHAVEDIFGTPAQIIFPSLDIASQSPTGCGGPTHCIFTSSPKVVPTAYWIREEHESKTGSILSGIRNNRPRKHGQTMWGPRSTRSPKAGTGIKTIACQSPSRADLWGSITPEAN